jgi:hypothetical protein
MYKLEVAGTKQESKIFLFAFLRPPNVQATQESTTKRRQKKKKKKISNIQPQHFRFNNNNNTCYGT